MSKLRGGMSPGQMEKFDPGVFDRLADELNPDHQEVMAGTDMKYRALNAILELAKQNPGGFALILNFLAELSRGYADKCAAVNPEADPHKTHGRMCFNAGAAWAYAEAASALHPSRISQRLAALRSDGTAIFSLDNDPSVD